MKDIKGRDMRAYDHYADEPRTGWTANAVELYLREGHHLYVDEDYNIYADNGDVLGKVEKAS